VLQINFECPYCKKSLMDPSYQIDDHPSLKVTIIFENKCGWIRMSSLYGSTHIESEHPIPDKTLTRFFCPNCGTELRSHRLCDKCNAPMVPFKITEGGLVEVCSRRGCEKHLAEFEDLEAELKAFYTAYSSYM